MTWDVVITLDNIKSIIHENKELIKLKTFALRNETSREQEDKKQYGKIFAKYISDKELLSKINKELLKLNNKTVNNSI